MFLATQHEARVYREDGGGFRVWCDTCGSYLGSHWSYDSAYSAAREHERVTGEEADDGTPPRAA